MAGELIIVNNKLLQKALHSRIGLAAPIANAQQSLAMANALHRGNNCGATSVKNQLFPSARKKRRAAAVVKNKGK